MWLGKKNKVEGYIKENIYKTIPKARKKYLKIIIKYNGPIEAPIKKDDIVGTYNIYYKDKLLDKRNIYASENVKRINIFYRLVKSINFLIWGDV